MEHALHLLLLLLVTRLFSELSERLRQPASMGEIVAGIAIALFAVASLPIPLLANLAESPFFEVAAEFGIFFLLLLAGIEMRPREIAEHPGARSRLVRSARSHLSQLVLRSRDHGRGDDSDDAVRLETRPAVISLSSPNMPRRGPIFSTAKEGAARSSRVMHERRSRL